MQIYLVGGAVRDLVLGRAAQDKDYLVLGGSQAKLLAIFPHAKQVGKNFPVFIIHGSEFSFLRGSSLEEDLLARDITINSMALAPDGSLVCHPQSIDDIKNKVLRPSSLFSAKADPLRVFRYARFYAMFPDFAPHPDLLSVMREAGSSHAFKDIAGDRVGVETRKALTAKAPENYLRLLYTGGCLTPWLKNCALEFDSLVKVMAQLHGKLYALWAVICCSGYSCPHLAARNARHLGKLLRMPRIYTEIGMRVAKSMEEAMGYGSLSSGKKVDLLIRNKKYQSYVPLFQIVDALGGGNYLTQVEKELALLSKITLPPKMRNQGQQSGILLRKLRIAALEQM